MLRARCASRYTEATPRSSPRTSEAALGGIRMVGRGALPLPDERLTLPAFPLQPETAHEHDNPRVPPKLIVSQPIDDLANKSTPRKIASKRRAGPRLDGKEQDWIDIDDPPPRRKRSVKRSVKRHDRKPRSSNSSQVGERSNESDIGRYLPKLGRILEGSESTTSSRPSTRGSDTRRSNDENTRRRHRHRDDSSSVYRRPVRHRTSAVQKRSDSLLRINPSLLSVLTTLTSTSDKSSGSNSTITQQSYNRRGSDSSRTPAARNRRPDPEGEPPIQSYSRPKSPNVFDYMVGPSIDGETDRRSIMSSSSSSSASSHYEPSIAGSSEAPDTLSSRSTFPSPTSTRSQSVAELRRKYDPQYAASATSFGSPSPASSTRSIRRQPDVSDVAEDEEEEEEEDEVDPAAPSEVNFDPQQRPSSRSSRSSRSSQRSTDRLRKQEETMRQHMAYANQAQHAHYVNPAYGQHRSPSMSSQQSTHSDQAAYAYHVAMQEYQRPSPPQAAPAMLPLPMNDRAGPADRPPAPDAPDLSQRTIVGYELLALELSATSSPVQPLYRKFEYLNHRILLHLQDELSELEEQLRTVDEIIAQLDQSFREGQRVPASRRAEMCSASEIHHRRIELLGRIFNKTKQYDEAMTAYNDMCRNAQPAEKEHVQEYQRWMSKHAPIHDIESRFLQRQDDLVMPGKNEPSKTVESPMKSALTYLPVALVLPLLLFSLIPTFAGRLAVTALLGFGAFLVAVSTRIRDLLPPHEWAICGAAYVLVMAAIAGCIPQHPV
jgi:hypothetical protein